MRRAKPRSNQAAKKESVKAPSVADIALHYYCRGIWDLLVSGTASLRRDRRCLRGRESGTNYGSGRGSVTKVWADNTDYVQKGDPLVTLDRTDAQQAFEKAKTQLAASVRQTRQQMINSKQLQANIDVKKTALAQAQADLNRRIPLGAANLIGREELQHARDTVASAQAELDVAIQQYNANQAIVLGTRLEQQPAVLQAATEVRNAWLALQRTQIVSPISGYVSRRSVQPGAQIGTTTPLMAVSRRPTCGSMLTLKRLSWRICVSASRPP